MVAYLVPFKLNYLNTCKVIILTCNLNYVACVNIIMLHFDLTKSHVNRTIMHFDIISLACRRQKYAIIINI